MEISYFLYKLIHIFLPGRQRPGWSKATPGDMVIYTMIRTTICPEEMKQAANT
jgi:hypothetical protein